MDTNENKIENIISDSDRQKLILKIKHSGVLGIIFGLIIIVLGIAMTFIIDVYLVSIIPSFITGLVFLILGYIVKSKPENSRKILRFLFAFTVVATLLFFGIFRNSPGLLNIIYIFITYGAWKASEKLEYQD